MTARENGFLDLYTRFRVNPASGENDKEVRRARVRRTWLLVSAPVLFGAACVAEILAATKVAVAIGVILAAACAVAGLALVTGIVASASAEAELTGVRDKTSSSVALLYDSLPGPDADDRDIADWVRRVEGVLGEAEPGLDPPVAS